MASSRIYTVTQLNQEIKSLLESNPSFFNLFVRGEISNYKPHPSGHHYMTIKDEGAAIQAVMFRSDAAKLRFRLQNGMKVVARGRISSFPKRGQVQLYLADMMHDGAGALHMQFEQLKEKLYAEGLFDPMHKRQIPPFPERIGLVTSPSGAAIRDMLRILARRWPMARIELYPSLVQGNAAPADLVRALQLANQKGTAEVLVIGRGGGSLEDLWAFNEECVARAIYESRIPVVSAVGHEPDVTISDFVADLRAPTPSGAAELIAPNAEDVRQTLTLLQHRMKTVMGKKYVQHSLRLEALPKRLMVRIPLPYLRDRSQLVQEFNKRLKRSMQSRMNEKGIAVDYAVRNMEAPMQHILIQQRARLTQSCAALDALSPLKVLSRGYAVVQNRRGDVVTAADRLVTGESICVRFAKGRSICEVREIKSEE